MCKFTDVVCSFWIVTAECRKKGKYLISRFLFLLVCVCVCVRLLPSGLPSPSTTCWRDNQFPILPWFLRSTTDELIRLSGERVWCCIKFFLGVSNSRRVSTESEDSPELYTEFTYHVQQNCLSTWVAANCKDVQLQMLPGARHPNSRTHTQTFFLQFWEL